MKAFRLSADRAERAATELDPPVQPPEALSGESDRRVAAAPGHGLDDSAPIAVACEKVEWRAKNEQILRDISLRFGRGSVVGVVGRNGAGKTTLLRLLAQEIRPSRGEVTYPDLEAAGLRNCSRSVKGAKCDGRGLRDGGIVLFYAGSSIFIAFGFALAFWFFGAYGSVWVLPYWNARLWYTPLYAAVVGLMACGPFLMAALFFWRADRAYAIPIERSVMPTPSLALFVLLVLSVTAAAVGDSGANASRDHVLSGLGAQSLPRC